MSANKKIISILLGSGFSYSAGLPLVTELNNTLTSLKPEDIFWGSDRYVFLLKGEKDPNENLTINKRRFFTEFIDYYCNLIGGKENFNYEIFYDEYTNFHRDLKNPNFREFCNSFRQRYNQYGIMDDDVNLINSFNDGFYQILRFLLGRAKFFENNVFQFNYTGYESFIYYLVDLAKEDYVVHIHTLNHDLLFDHIGNSTEIQSYFCDGYSELGTNYYGDFDYRSSISVEFKVRLKSFQNHFNLPIRFYKLHGSIDTYSFSLAYPTPDRTRIKTNYGVDNFWKEVYDEKTDTYSYARGITSVYPDFLSGTTEKVLNYSDPYYEIMFNYFKGNLESSDKLIIVGYGGGDLGINDLISSHFISHGKIPCVIDPYASTKKFYQDNKCNLFEKGIAQVSLEEFKSM